MSFDIRNYLDALEPSPKSDGKFFCPGCGGNDLSINTKTGAYSCFGSGCDPADIRNAIAPLSQGSSRPRNSGKAKPKTQRQTAKDKARSVQLNSAQVEIKVDELLLSVAEKYHSLEQAQVELGNWCKVEGLNNYDAGQLFKAKAKDLGLGNQLSGLTTAELVTRIQAHDELESPTDRWEAWEAIKADSGKTHRDLMELARAIKVKPDEADSAWAISAKEFGALDLGAREWLFEGLLPANRSILIGADAKTGKSLLVYDWAYRLATGQSWGEFPCDRLRKVLIVQTDESEIDCQERVNVRGLNELENVRIIRHFTPSLMARLKRVATAWGAEVIIFDSLTSIQRHSGYSPKDPEYGYWLYDLKDFAAECRITPILVTHTNKAAIELGLDKVAGSYSITAAVSEIFMITRPAEPTDDCDRVLVRVGSRSAGQSAWLIGLNLEDFSWEYKFPCQRDGKPLEDDGSFTPDQKLSCRENVVKFLAHHNGKGFDAREISEILGANHNNVRKVCTELRAGGIISRRKAGKAWVYSCKLPIDPLPSIAQEQNPEKNSPMDQNAPLPHREGGFQVDQISDLPPSDGSLDALPSDLSFEPLSDRELEIMGGGPDADS
ncbi:MAG: AAA family ATPase [Nodosilinea sp.]